MERLVRAELGLTCPLLWVCFLPAIFPMVTAPRPPPWLVTGLPTGSDSGPTRSVIFPEASMEGSWGSGRVERGALG